MMLEFQAEASPSAQLYTQLERLAPANPFYTRQYSQARKLQGYEPWIVYLRGEGEIKSACTAFLKAGRLHRRLEITSWPSVPQQRTFSEGLLRCCREHGISFLQVDSFCSPSAHIPEFGCEVTRRTRHEFVLLLSGLAMGKMSSNHRRNIRKGEEHGITLLRAVTTTACEQHAILIQNSLIRRQARGVAIAPSQGTAQFSSLLASGAGELFQAVRGEQVLSSILLLFAKSGVYYHSAGTSAAGMEIGASHFLLLHAMEAVRREGIQHFNLGGAADPGLRRFKSGFGASEVALEAAEFFVGSRIGKMVARVAHLVSGIRK